ncbi:MULTISPECIES: nucleoside-diphosphate sugar epimerase [Paenibacillus]|uniref:Nucleoside-diphosphate sugar epimerase n=2 Tax=Paenibacillus TaxID=44249 RepID=A0A1V4HBD2_9BACL|nr:MULTISPECIES: nucleoside-diphosphate sugar epimerase [Paenibacillus]MEC0232230.1 nucleoside-diphosphate sugar epimerase [Paenibacillus alba]NQX69331.1 nucleoside-diphosphate sugar epimerase [Paenibacillus alba]OPH48656.1 nucleoside-diphosphate sugar epimerase [Paenibacillus ferrarius]
MEQRVTTIISHIAASHREMSKILEAKRSISTQMASIAKDIPDSHPDFEGLSMLQEQALQLTKNITAYLNSLANLEEAIAQQTEIVMKEMKDPEDEE